MQVFPRHNIRGELVPLPTGLRGAVIRLRRRRCQRLELGQRGGELDLDVRIAGDDLGQPRLRLAMPGARPADWMTYRDRCRIGTDQVRADLPHALELCEIVLPPRRPGQSPVQV